MSDNQQYMYYGAGTSPHHGPGSLGTPYYPGASPYHRRSTPKGGQGAGGAPMGSDVILTPTRPVLKAVARACKCPPWSVGRMCGPSLDDELGCFQMFVNPAPSEKGKIDEMFNSIAYKARDVWSACNLSTCNAMYLGIHIPGSLMECVVVNSSDEADEIKTFSAGLNEAGFSTEIFQNSRGTQSIRLIEARSGDRVVVHVGRMALDYLQSSERIRAIFDGTPGVRGVVSAIDTVMRQSKYGDDGTTPGGISSEAIAVMVAAMLGKYPAPPAPGVIMLDFFITYGYHFDCQTHAIAVDVNTEGWPAKPDPATQLYVIDPAAPDRNLTASVAKFPQVKSLFQYCYMTLNQWSAMVQENRAQSPLSTIVGGETFWSRVLLLALAGEEPYATVINDKKPYLRI
eukprot:PhF_6_TR25121/c0_g1_i1/m.34551/K03514/PAPD5_7, TRF4; non-canonical poly(A) RNA polymerase PAPD5/7